MALNISGGNSKEIMEHVHNPQNALMHQKIQKVEFKLNKNGDSQVVQTAYIKAGLPANGPMVKDIRFHLNGIVERMGRIINVTFARIT